VARNSLAALDDGGWGGRLRRGGRVRSDLYSNGSPVRGKYADVLGIRQRRWGSERVRVELRPTGGIVVNISEDHCASGMSAGTQFHVSRYQEGSVELGRFAISDIDVGGIWKVIQDALCHAARESIVTAPLLIHERGTGGIDSDIASSMDIDQNRLAFTAVAEFYTRGRVELFVLVGADIENLNIVFIAALISSFLVLEVDLSGARKRLPVL